MKKPTNVSNTTEAISQNVHRHDKWLITQRKNAEKRLSPKHLHALDNKSLFLLYKKQVGLSFLYG